MQVGSHWASPENPCLINECVRVKEEVFVQQRNVSCPMLDVPTCPVGFQLSCKTSGCCPTCRCGKTPCLALPSSLFPLRAPESLPFEQLRAMGRIKIFFWEEAMLWEGGNPKHAFLMLWGESKQGEGTMTVSRRSSLCSVLALYLVSRHPHNPPCEVGTFIPPFAPLSGRTGIGPRLL